MLGEEEKKKPLPLSLPPPLQQRKAYLRSVSWSDRSPSKLAPSPRAPPNNNKARLCLPPLQPLSVSRGNIEDWPKAGSDDLGVWPNAQTPRGGNGSSDGREFQFKRDKLAYFDKECSKIAEHIYLGSDAVAKNRETLRQHGITHVLNCVGFVSPEYFKKDLVYKTLWLQDSPSEDITSILYDVFDYFEDVREQGGRVLVHCCQGVSRSTSLVIAYLMWREGQSFEDAFQYVKAARGVTNPNMGFACQLLLRQKRANVLSPSSARTIRMYRMAPHSPYDPLHLVPKQLGRPSAKGLDSRGAFLVHVPDAIYVWVGKNCEGVMLNKAMDAASQVVRYERAKGPISRIGEGEEPSEFWDSLSNRQLLSDGDERFQEAEESSSSRSDNGYDPNCVEIGGRRVKDYDLDFEIFYKALSGGVVPPFSVPSTDSETCLPAWENGWNRLRQKFANGLLRQLVTSSKLKTVSNTSYSAVPSSPRESEDSDCVKIPSSPSTPSTHPCSSPDSFSCFLKSSTDRIRDAAYKDEEEGSNSSSPYSFSRIPIGSPIFSSKSPTLSPSTSDYSGSSFTFSPSSSNWSDFPYQSSRQASPSGAGNTPRKDILMWDKMASTYREIPASPIVASPRDVFPANQVSSVENAHMPIKSISPSIAERRGSNPPPRMRLPSVDEHSKVHRKLVRSWSFSMPDLDDEVMQDADHDLPWVEDEKEEILREDDGAPMTNLKDETLMKVDEGNSFRLSTMCW